MQTVAGEIDAGNKSYRVGFRYREPEAGFTMLSDFLVVEKQSWIKIRFTDIVPPLEMDLSEWEEGQSLTLAAYAADWERVESSTEASAALAEREGLVSVPSSTRLRGEIYDWVGLVCR